MIDGDLPEYARRKRAEWREEQARIAEEEAQHRRTIGDLFGANALPPVLPPPSRPLDLEAVRNPPREAFLIGRLFPRGKASVFYGPTTVGKSILLSQLAFGLAAGTSQLWEWISARRRSGARLLRRRHDRRLDAEGCGRAHGRFP
jgi:anti-sigma factor RsiW